MQILNVEAKDYSEKARKIIEGLGDLTEGQLDRKEIIEKLRDFDVLIVRLRHQIDKEIIDSGTNLRVIVTATTGLDHIDTTYASSKGISVLSLNGESAFLRSIHATPEHTWALLLALVRNIHAAFASVREGSWDRDTFRGRELSGKRLGIVGLGRIGSKVAQYGLCFGMDVAAYDPYIDEWVSEVRRIDTLEKLLARADILSLHVPLNPETTSLIDLPQFNLLPQGSILVNTARMELVNESALVKALNDGTLYGAAIDFLPLERFDAKRRSGQLLEHARTHENLIITPHLAGSTYESFEKTEIFMAQKLSSYIQNHLHALQ